MPLFFRPPLHLELGLRFVHSSSRQPECGSSEDGKSGGGCGSPPPSPQLQQVHIWEGGSAPWASSLEECWRCEGAAAVTAPACPRSPFGAPRLWEKIQMGSPDSPPPPGEDQLFVHVRAERGVPPGLRLSHEERHGDQVWTGDLQKAPPRLRQSIQEKHRRPGRM